jgi:hypothetical protein
MRAGSLQKKILSLLSLDNMIKEKIENGMGSSG